MDVSTHSPTVFDDLVGQQAAVEELRRTLESGQPTHAWLFTGPPGSGRSNAALAFATALNCQQGTGCGVCPSCRHAANKTHPAITMVSTENTSYRIDDVRGLISTAQERAQGYRWRIIIIEDADRMTERAGNVLLKTLEEPVEQTIWILCAPSPADVLITIRSRCRNISLRIAAREDVAQLLIKRDNLSPEHADFAARVAQNHIGIARQLARSSTARAHRERVVQLPLQMRSVSDAVLASSELVTAATAQAQEESNERTTAELNLLRQQLGLDADEKIPAKQRAQFKRIEEDGDRRAKRSVNDTLDRAFMDLSALYRDVLTICLAVPAELVNAHLSEQLHAVAETMSPESVLHRLDAITEARLRMNQNVPPQLAVEALMMALLPEQRRR